MKRQAAQELQQSVARERALQIQLTDTMHDNHRVKEENNALEERIAKVIDEAEKAQKALQSLLREREARVQDLNAEVVATRNKLPPVIAAHEAKERRWEQEMADTKTTFEKDIQELESEMENLAKQLEDATRQCWNEQQEKNLTAERLEATVQESRATMQRMEQEKTSIKQDLQAQLYNERQQHSLTSNELANTSDRLAAAIEDGNNREAAAIEKLNDANRVSSRTLARKDREIEAVTAEKDENISMTKAAKRESEKLRKDLRALLAHNAHVEKNSAELVGTVQELQDTLHTQAEVMETENKIMSLKLKEEVDAVCLEASESIRMANERVDRAETLEEITHDKMLKLQHDVEKMRRQYR